MKESKQEGKANAGAQTSLTAKIEAFIVSVFSILSLPFRAISSFIASWETPKYFFWWCAGAHRETLEQCPADQHKYVGMGFTVFITGVLATLAGGFAMNSLSDSKFLVLCFALIWGFMIFNLDRFIVSSMSRKNRWSVIPRFFLAAVIAVTISKPLEIEIFRNQVNFEAKRYAEENRSSMVEKLKESMRTEELREELYNIRRRKDSISMRLENAPDDISSMKNAKNLYTNCDENTTKQIKDLDASRTKLLDQVEKTRVDPNYTEYIWNQSQRKEIRKLTTSGRQRVASLSAQVNKLNQEKDKLLTRCDDFKIRMQDIDANIRLEKGQDILNQTDAEKSKVREIEVADSSFYAQLELYDMQIKNSGFGLAAEVRALHSLGQEDSSMRFLGYFLMLLFFVVETAPILAKLLMPASAYDAALEDIEAAILHKIEREKSARNIERKEWETMEQIKSAYSDTERDDVILDLKKRLEQSKLEKQEALDLLRESQESKLGEIRREKEHNFDLQEELYREKVELAKTEYQAKLDQLKAETQSAREGFMQRELHNLEQLQEQHESFLQTERKKRESVLAEIKQEHSYQLELLRQEQDSIKARNSKVFESEEAIQAINSQLRKLEESFEQEMRILEYQAQERRKKFALDIEKMEQDIYHAREKEVINATTSQMGDAQEEIAKTIIEKWRKNELQRVKTENPENNVFG